MRLKTDSKVSNGSLPSTVGGPLVVNSSHGLASLGNNSFPQSLGLSMTVSSSYTGSTSPIICNTVNLGGLGQTVLPRSVFLTRDSALEILNCVRLSMT